MIEGNQLGGLGTGERLPVVHVPGQVVTGAEQGVGAGEAVLSAEGRALLDEVPHRADPLGGGLLRPVDAELPSGGSGVVLEQVGIAGVVAVALSAGQQNPLGALSVHEVAGVLVLPGRLPEILEPVLAELLVQELLARLLVELAAVGYLQDPLVNAEAIARLQPLQEGLHAALGAGQVRGPDEQDVLAQGTVVRLRDGLQDVLAGPGAQGIDGLIAVEPHPLDDEVVVQIADGDCGFVRGKRLLALRLDSQVRAAQPLDLGRQPHPHVVPLLVIRHHDVRRRLPVRHQRRVQVGLMHLVEGGKAQGDEGHPLVVLVHHRQRQGEVVHHIAAGAGVQGLDVDLRVSCALRGLAQHLIAGPVPARRAPVQVEVRYLI